MKKLYLNRELVRVLESGQLTRAKGGQEFTTSGWPPCLGSNNCPTMVPSCYHTDCTTMFTTF